jgi:hypothetical protein
MTYKEQFHTDVKEAKSYLEDLKKSAWIDESTMIIGVNILIQLTANMYRMIAEIGDKIDGNR